ncbi:MAG TPA: arginase family protein [Longimicrobiales bacterium]
MQAVDLVTVPYDSGRRGHRMGAGPQALLKGGLVQKLRAAGYDTELVPVESAGTSTDAITVAFELAARIARVVRASRSAGRFPLTISGNCFGTVGALAGLSADAPALVWLDAHGDLNTPETSPSGFLDGMAAATALGWCHTDRSGALDGFSKLAEADLLVIGVRDLDAPEAELVKRSAVRALGPGELGSLESALDSYSGRAVYLHLDVDVLDPDRVGPANTYATPNGLSVADVANLIRALAARSVIAGMTVASYDPAVDTSGAIARATLELIEQAVGSAHGRPPVLPA